MKRKYITLVDMMIATAFLGFFITQFYQYKQTSRSNADHIFNRTLAYEYADSAFALIRSQTQKYIENKKCNDIFRTDIPLDLLSHGNGEIHIEEQKKMYVVHIDIDYTIHKKKFFVKVVNSIEK